MAFHFEAGAGTDRATGTRDWVNKKLQFLCSQHVDSVAVNSGGTGYSVGDVLTLAHASAHLAARFEVVTESAGVITALRIVSSGAYAQQATSATVSAGGGSYAVGDILEVQGGSSRLPAKFTVATLSGSAVATVALVEGGGAYSSTPSNPAATVGVGPSAFAGDDACTLTVSYQSIIGTTGLSVTGGGGSGATVDISLAETGHSVVQNRNDWSYNGETDERQAVLVADATGLTNKPYFGLRTGTDDVGIDVRHWVAFSGFIAFNPSLTDFLSQPGVSPGWDTGDVPVDGGSYLVFPQNVANEVDFWFCADDVHHTGRVNTNPAANTDDGRYEDYYQGYGNRVKTETEDPFPMLNHASSRDRDANPTSSSTSITSIAELRAPSLGPCWAYLADQATWVSVKNDDTSGGVGGESNAMFPFGELPPQEDGGDAETVVAAETPMYNDDVFKRDRSAATRVLRMVPGSTPYHALWPLIFARKVTDQFAPSTDSVRLTVRNNFAVFNSDSSGAAITNFSEDIIEDANGDRYYVFHNWDLAGTRYQFTCLKEDV